MRVAGVASTLLIVGFLVHWVVWHIRIPRRQSFTLLVIFTGVLVCGMAAAASGFLWPGHLGLRGFWECLHVAIIHIGTMLAYVVVYSALEERSPSMTLLTWVADAGGLGRTREELESVLQGISPVEIRMAATVRDRMVREDRGMYHLTSKGRQWVLVFSSWRRLLGYSKGG